MERPRPPSVDEFNLLQRVCTTVRCHRDANFKAPVSTTVRVQERFVWVADGIELTLEHHAHGLRTLSSKAGWFYVLPWDRGGAAGSESPHGALSIFTKGSWEREIIYLKMRHA